MSLQIQPKITLFPIFLPLSLIKQEENFVICSRNDARRPRTIDKDKALEIESEMQNEQREFEAIFGNSLPPTPSTIVSKQYSLVRSKEPIDFVMNLPFGTKIKSELSC